MSVYTKGSVQAGHTPADIGCSIRRIAKAVESVPVLDTDFSFVAYQLQDDWDTDPDYANNLTEKEQRKGSALLQPPSDAGVIDMKKLREEVSQEDAQFDRTMHSSKRQQYGAQ